MKNKTITINIAWLWIILIIFVIFLISLIIGILKEGYREKYEIDFEGSNCSKIDTEWDCSMSDEAFNKCARTQNSCSRSCSGKNIYKCNEVVLKRK